MAHSSSARKRFRQNEKRRVQNRARKSRIKTQTKRVLGAVAQQDPEKAERELRAAYKVLDHIGQTSAIHPNAAARKKSRLAKKVNALRQAAAPSAPEQA